MTDAADVPNPDQLVPGIIEGLKEDLAAVETAMAFVGNERQQALEEARDSIWRAICCLQQWDAGTQA